MHCLWQKAHLMQHSLHRELPEHIISARLQVGQQRLPGRAGKHFSRHLRAAHFLLTTHAVTRTVQLLSGNHQSKAANKSCLKETRKWVTVTSSCGRPPERRGQSRWRAVVDRSVPVPGCPHTCLLSAQSSSRDVLWSCTDVWCLQMEGRRCADVSNVDCWRWSETLR